MDFTKSIGSVTELQCLSKFIEMGFDCSIPYGDAAKYDFIADIDGELIKIQCKSCYHPKKPNGERDTEAIMFSCSTQTTNTKKTTRHRYSKQDIDYFATYYKGNIYVVPLEECSISKTLRFSAPNNGNDNYNLANDYLIENVFGHKQDEKFLKQMSEYNEDKIKETEIFKCSQCHSNTVYYKGGICRECSRFNLRRTERPNRKELKDMIRKKSFLEIGKIFGVTDTTIRNWCEFYNLPSRKTDIKKFSNKEWEKI